MCFRLVLQFAMKIEMKGSFMILHNQCCFIKILLLLFYYIANLMKKTPSPIKYSNPLPAWCLLAVC